MTNLTTSFITPAAAQTRVELSADFLIRIAGLPLDVLDSFRTVKTAGWADRVLGLERQMEQLRDPLVELVHGAVQAAGDNNQTRQALIDAKRSIFNKRPAKNPARLRAAAQSLPDAVAQPLLAWLDCSVEHGELLRTGDKSLEADLVSLRPFLKTLAQLPEFRRGALIASPTFEESLDAYIQAADDHMPRRLRLTERTLLLYVLRTTTKTSPFSSFTSVATGRFDAGVAVATGLELRGMHRRRIATLNFGLLNRLAAAVAGCATVRPKLPMALKPDYTLSGSDVHYLRRMVNFTKGRGPVDSNVDEQMFRLPVTPTLENLMRVLAGGKSLCFAELELEMVAGGTLSPPEVREYLLLLIRLDLLYVPGFRLAMDSRSPAAQFADALDQIDEPTLTRVAESVRRSAALVAEFPDAGLKERRAVPRKLKEEFDVCCGLLETPSPEMPQALLYEDETVETIPAIRMNAASVAAPVRDLEELAQALPVFDLLTTPRLAMNALFKKIYGAGQRCDHVVSFLDIFHQDFYRPYLEAKLTEAPGKPKFKSNPLRVAEIDFVERAQMEIFDAVASLAASSASEVRLPRDVIRDIVARMPATLRRLRSNTFFVQPVSGQEGARLVVNHIYSGFGQMYSRFVRLCDPGRTGLEANLRKALPTRAPKGAVLAEFGGGYDHNLNFHPALTSYALRFPGERHLRPEENLLDLTDLAIVHDAAQDRLRLVSTRLNREVVPTYFGFLFPLFLPYLQQALMLFSPAILAEPGWWSKAEGAENQMLHRPALCFGDVVLERESWFFPADSLPKRGPADGDSAYFLAIARWRENHGLPNEVFVQPTKKAMQEAGQPEQASEQGAERMVRKPMYVDFRNWFTVALLEKALIDNGGGLRVTRMQPAPAEAWLHEDGRSRAAEFMIEITQLETGDDNE